MSYHGSTGLEAVYSFGEAGRIYSVLPVIGFRAFAPEEVERIEKETGEPIRVRGIALVVNDDGLILDAPDAYETASLEEIRPCGTS